MFTKSYLELCGQTVTQHRTGLEVLPTLTSEEELFFFTLLSLKVSLAYDLLGLLSKMGAANTKRNQQLSLDILRHPFPTAPYLPRQTYATARESAKQSHRYY